MGPETGPETLGPAALVGRLIAGYRLERVLGTGVTGAVLLGRLGDAPDHLAAIRVLMLPLQTPAAVRAEFRQALAHEAHTLFALRHPHILRVYAFGEDLVTDFPYMVVPYMPGGSLAARLASGALPLPAVATQLAALADALDYAHSRGIVHGDIKPANILYDAHGQAQLADFGIARLFEMVYGAAATAGLGQGSAAYIAPEQALGEQVGPAADLYSLGVVLYQMVTGHVPFEGSSPTAVMLKHLQQPPPTPAGFRPALGEAAEAVILRSLAKEPQARFPTASALAEAFARAVGEAAEVAGAEARAEVPTEDGQPPARIEIQLPVAVALPVQQTAAEGTAAVDRTAADPAVQQHAPVNDVATGDDSAEGRDAAEQDASATGMSGAEAVELPGADAGATPETRDDVGARPASPAPESLASPVLAAAPSAPAGPEAAPVEPLAGIAFAVAPATPPAQHDLRVVAAPAAQETEATQTHELAAVMPEAEAPPELGAPPAEPPPTTDVPALAITPAEAGPREEQTDGARVAAAEPSALEPSREPVTPPAEAPEPTAAEPIVPPASPKKPWFTPERARTIMVVVFFGVLALAFIAVIKVLGIPQALLMALVLALLALIVVAVPAHTASDRASAHPTGDLRGDLRDAGQV